MSKLYWRLKSWYYLKFHGVILGRISEVQVWDKHLYKPGESIKGFTGSDKSLIDAYKFSTKEQDNRGRK